VRRGHSLCFGEASPDFGRFHGHCNVLGLQRPKGFFVAHFFTLGWMLSPMQKKNGKWQVQSRSKKNQHPDQKEKNRSNLKHIQLEEVKIKIKDMPWEKFFGIGRHGRSLEKNKGFSAIRQKRGHTRKFRNISRAGRYQVDFLTMFTNRKLVVKWTAGGGRWRRCHHSSKPPKPEGFGDGKVFVSTHREQKEAFGSDERKEKADQGCFYPMPYQSNN